MIKIRNNTFETNSSSTHSMVIGLRSDIEKWMSGELWYDGEKDVFLTPDQAKEEMIKSLSEEDKVYFSLSSIEEKESFLEENYPFSSVESFESDLCKEFYLFTYDAYCDWYERLETDTTYYTTPGGEEIGIICSYGYDG